ncbi:hypothetical protein Q8F55_004237 [Vanrija albida]|uniref:C3H1-type domain-containing protein n=1 Tax=Vanrija albida TaxID=181172 RepID=A0ABR3Q6H2_9TREE
MAQSVSLPLPVFPQPKSFAQHRRKVHTRPAIDPVHHAEHPADVPVDASPSSPGDIAPMPDAAALSTSLADLNIVSLNTNVASAQATPTTADVYRIPQRTPGYSRAPPPTPVRGPPGALKLTSGAPHERRNSLTSPRTPSSAPAGRLAGAAAARGISIDTALGRKEAGPGTGGLASSLLRSSVRYAALTGDLTPPSAPPSARPRGLTVAILMGDGEMVAESAPVTPGLASAGVGAQRSALVSAVTGEVAADLRRKQIILCRYYHTPGLTCTSRPCRFVHSLEALNLSKEAAVDVGSLPMLSPRTGLRTVSSEVGEDPTRGTFALAQSTQPPTPLQVDTDMSAVEPGGAVAVKDLTTGDEVVGFVFKMSGGGKGPAGKSRAKYKTVPCKDFAEGSCPYGDYCSFIHDLDNLYDPAKHDKAALAAAAAEQGTPAASATHKNKANGRGVNDRAGSSSKPPSDNGSAALTYSPPADEVLTPVDEDTEITIPSLATVAAPILRSPPHRRLERVHIPDNRQLHPIRPVSNMYHDEQMWDHGHAEAAAAAAAAAAQAMSPISPGPNSAAFYHYQPSMWSPDWPPIAQQMMWQPGVQDAVGYGASPTYPWGMPLSPVGGVEPEPQPQPPVMMPPGMAPPPMAAPMVPPQPPGPPPPPSGPDVVWTPGGWAVQDAGMKFTHHEQRPHHVPAVTPTKSYYRTRPCQFFANGYCPHGEACAYLHSVEPPQPKSKATRPNIRTVPCKFFNSTLGCQRSAEECNFAHIRVVPDNEPIVDKPRPWRTRPCRHFQLGRCKLGDTCHFAHVLDEGASALPPTTSSPASERRHKRDTSESIRRHKRDASDANIKDYAYLYQREATPTSGPSSSPPASERDGRDLLPSEPCSEWARTGHCANGAWCRYYHSGSGFIGELTDASLNEESVEGACEDMREKIRGGSVNTHFDDDDDDDDDDDVEIVTMDTRSAPARRSSS